MDMEMGAALLALVIALTNWIKGQTDVSKIKSDRAETKAVRDADSQRMHDELIRMQCEQKNQSDNIKVLFEKSVDNSKQITELTSQLREVIVQMKLILDTLKEIKDK